jgi:cysteine-rich repeat protein/predicted outer membrane repeat protein
MKTRLGAMRTHLAWLLIAACQEGPADLQVELSFAANALPAPQGAVLTAELLLTWPGGQASDRAAYGAGSTLALMGLPSGADRRLTASIRQGDRLLYVGRSDLFVLTGEAQVVSVLLQSAPQFGEGGAQLLGALGPYESQQGVTRSATVDVSVDVLVGSQVRVRNAGGDARDLPLSELQRAAGTQYILSPWVLPAVSCQEYPGTCRRDYTVEVSVLNDEGNESALQFPAIAFDDLGWDCAASACAPICGDGRQVGHEACDDGNTQAGDYCRGDCGEVTGRCGDGALQAVETCDDANPDSGDGCFGCALEPGWRCAESPSQCYRVWRVDAEATGVTGAAWGDALGSLQETLGLAQSGDEIWLKAGTYYPDVGPGIADDDTAASFHLIEGTRILGGFSGIEEEADERDPAVHASILSGQIFSAMVNATQSVHVVSAGAVSASTLVDGVTVKDGNASGSGSEDRGGCLHVDRGSPTFRDVAFENCQGSYGGAVYLTQASATFDNVRFASNVAATKGGAVYAYRSEPRFYATLFHGNRVGLTTSVPEDGGRGGAIAADHSQLTLDRARFESNTASGFGGAIYNERSSIAWPRLPSRVANSVFVRNRAKRGGAVYNDDNDITLVNVSAAANCGAHYTDPTFMGSPQATCLADDEQFGSQGGAVHHASGSLVVLNSILWGDMPAELHIGAGGVVRVKDSCVSGGYAGEGVFDLDPSYRDVAPIDDEVTRGRDDLRLASDSDAKDLGNAIHLMSGETLDNAGDARIAGGSVDLGAYELP